MYLTFIRPTERAFGAQLDWGHQVLHYNLFYRSKGTPYTSPDQLTKLLRQTLHCHLGHELSLSQWRHIATALGRMALAEEMQAIRSLEIGILTNGMDALAGRTSAVSSKRYAVDRDQHGNIDAVGMEVYENCNVAWHRRVLGQDMTPSVSSAPSSLDRVFHTAIEATAVLLAQSLPVQTCQSIGIACQLFGARLLQAAQL
jgi:hypothetical protein